MSNIYIYSREQFEDYYIPTNNFTNGALIKSYTFNRNNFRTDIYVNYSYFRGEGRTGVIKPIVYRGYRDENNALQYDKFEHEVLTAAGDEQIAILKYNSLQERDYINYRVEFECIDDIVSCQINEVGLIFESDVNNKGIFGTANRSISFSGSNSQDINQNFLTYQTYQKGYAVTLYTNRQNLDRIINILESPFKLVDIKNDCIDNSTRELSLQNISINYPTSGTQYIEITINNIEEI